MSDQGQNSCHAMYGRMAKHNRRLTVSRYSVFFIFLNRDEFLGWQVFDDERQQQAALYIRSLQQL